MSGAKPLLLLHVFKTKTGQSFPFIEYVQLSNLFQIFQQTPLTHIILLNRSSYIQSYTYWRTQG